MTTTVSVVLHDLEDVHALNPAVSEILRLLDRPLPTEQLNEARLLPILPPDFQCVKSLSVASKNDNGQTRPPGIKLVTDILDVVLMSVVYLRTSRQCSHGFRERQSYWVSMLAACGMAMDEKVIVSEDIPIARARTSSRKDIPLNLEELNAEAKMTLSALIPPTSRHHPRAQRSEEEQDSSSISDASYDSYVTVDLPFDAHVTPGLGKRAHCLLPVVFAARQEDMQALMTSIVCQRRFLNITTPVVGLVLSEEGTLASLSLGWADCTNQPTVHLAYTRPDSGNNVGLFDGSNPISALRLAQFILDLEPHFASVKQHAVEPQTQDFCWRLDHAYLDHSHISRSRLDNAICLNDGQNRVTEWLTTLHLADTPEPIPPLSWEFFGLAEGLLAAEGLAANPTTASLPSDSSSTMSDSRSRRSGRNTNKSQSSAPTSPPESSKSALLSPDSARQKSNSGKSGSQQQQSDTGASPSAPSASNYAKPIGDDPRGLTWYCRYRDSIPLAVLATSSENAIDRATNEMAMLYDARMQPGWPQDWKTLSDLPACDSSLTPIRKALFNGYQELIESKVKFNKLKKDSTVVASVKNKFSTILYAVAIAVAATGNSQDGAHVEASTRDAWDFILRSICCAPEEATCNTFFVERTIQLAANKALREDFDTKRSAALEAHLTNRQAKEFGDLAWTEHNPDEASRLVTLTEQAQHARGQAEEHAKHTQQVPESFRERAAAATEPRTARVDGMYCLRYNPGVTSPPPPSERVGQVKEWMSNFFRFLHLHPKSPSPVCKAKPVNPKQRSPDQNQQPPNELPHPRCFACPNISRSLRTDQPFTWPKIVRSDGDIFVPVLFAEYKKDSYQIQQAYNQMKFYVISGVEFLASIGVQDFPVWGIVCSGNEGVIAMAWKTTLSCDQRNTKLKPRDYNFIFDRNLRRFNLSDPIQAFQFFVVVYGLYETQEELRRQLDKSRVKKKLMGQNFSEWMMPKPEPTTAVQAK